MAHRLMHLRAPLLSLLVCVVLSVGGAVHGVAPGAAASGVAVTWSVDHRARTITVTANLVFYVTPAPSGPYETQRLEATVDRIKDAIETQWSGHPFKCYSLVVKVNAGWTDGQQGVRDDEIPVRLDLGVYPGKEVGKLTGSRSYVTHTPSGADGYLLDSSQFTPRTGPSTRPSAWSFAAPDGTYAHEFGHILGLDDNYVEKSWALKDGAADDIMFDKNYPLSDASIVKAVRRSGQVDEKSIRCPLRIDLVKSTIGLLGFAGGTIEVHGCAPDYSPESTDKSRPAGAEFHGVVDVSGEADTAIPVVGSASGSGSYEFRTVWTSPSGSLAIPNGDGSQIVQMVEATGQGPMSLPQSAYLSSAASQVGLGNIMTIQPFAGPCS